MEVGPLREPTRMGAFGDGVPAFRSVSVWPALLSAAPAGADEFPASGFDVFSGCMLSEASADGAEGSEAVSAGAEGLPAAEHGCGCGCSQKAEKTAFYMFHNRVLLSVCDDAAVCRRRADRQREFYVSNIQEDG